MKKIISVLVGVIFLCIVFLFNSKSTVQPYKNLLEIYRENIGANSIVTSVKVGTALDLYPLSEKENIVDFLSSINIEPTDYNNDRIDNDPYSTYRLQVSTDKDFVVFTFHNNFDYMSYYTNTENVINNKLYAVINSDIAYNFFNSNNVIIPFEKITIINDFFNDLFSNNSLFHINEIYNKTGNTINIPKESLENIYIKSPYDFSILHYYSNNMLTDYYEIYGVTEEHNYEIHYRFIINLTTNNTVDIKKLELVFL